MQGGNIARGDPGKIADLIITLLGGYDFYRAIREDDEEFEEFSRFLKEKVLAMLRTSRQG